MTRLWREGDPITVTSDATAAPLTFAWRGQTHRVAAIGRRWRIDIEWWRGRIWRANFKVSTDTGLLVEIYQDLLTGRWYLQRLYD